MLKMCTPTLLYVLLFINTYVYTTSMKITEKNIKEIKNDIQLNTIIDQVSKEVTKVQQPINRLYVKQVDFKKFEDLVKHILLNNYDKKINNKDRSTAAGERLRRSRRSAYMSDHGYGSRVQAGSYIAQDVSAIHDIFGKYGVGKRNKNNRSDSFTRGVANMDKDFDYRRAAANAFLLGTKYAEKQTKFGRDYLANSLSTTDGLIVPVDLDSATIPTLIEISDLESANTYEKRSLTDYGYGSRVDAGSKLANSLWTKDILYGPGGPGKRSTGGVNNLKRDAPETENVFQKRYLTDYGYGSRVAAANRVANSLRTKESLYGSGGPGKRSTQIDNDTLDPDIELSGINIEHLPKQDTLDFSYESRFDLLNKMKKVVLAAINEFEYVGHNTGSENNKSKDMFSRSLRKEKERVSDHGYGSRIHAGSKIAHDTLAMKHLFGTKGPGRKKRNEVVDSTYFELEDSI